MPLIIDDDAIGIIDKDKCNSQLEMLQKCKKCPLIGKKKGAEMVVTPKNVFACSQILAGKQKKMKMAST